MSVLIPGPSHVSFLLRKLQGIYLPSVLGALFAFRSPIHSSTHTLLCPTSWPLISQFSHLFSHLCLFFHFLGDILNFIFLPFYDLIKKSAIFNLISKSSFWSSGKFLSNSLLFLVLECSIRIPQTLVIRLLRSSDAFPHLGVTLGCPFTPQRS